jgi:hypothetical protein
MMSQQGHHLQDDTVAVKGETGRHRPSRGGVQVETVAAILMPA